MDSDIYKWIYVHNKLNISKLDRINLGLSQEYKDDSITENL
jgi:hypothetical protein